MQIEHGIQMNCSETVFRIPKEVVKDLPKSIMDPERMFGGWNEPVEGYSQMRPTEDTVCIYYYQTSGGELFTWLELNKIPYDCQFSFGDPDDPDSEMHGKWERIELTAIENELPATGGSGDCYRRKPYGN
jgi:hypothetical protein